MAPRFRPRAVRCAAAAGLLLAAAPAARAQAGVTTVTRRGPSHVDVAPGEGVSAVFLLANPTTRRRVAQGVVELPPEWRLLVPEGRMELAAGASDIRIVRIVLPAGASPGRHTIRYLVVGDSHGRVVSHDSLIVTVKERRRLSLELLEAPAMVQAGDGYRSSFVVRNRGNVRSAVRFDVSSGRALVASVDSAPYSLEPGEMRSVHVAVRTDRRAAGSLKYRIDLCAHDAADSSAKSCAFSLVDVIEREGGHGGGSRFHQIPMQLSVRATDEGEGLTAEVRGSGMLAEGGATRLDFVARGPRAQQSISGEQDQYSLALRSPRYELRLGDQNFALSPLTDVGRYGFGAGASVDAGPFTGGGFAHRNRWTYDLTGEAARGAFVQMRVGGQSQLAINYLARDGYLAGELWSLRGVVTPLRRTTLDLEYSEGAGDAGRGRAHVVNLTGALSRLTYGFRHLRGTPEFPGHVRGASEDHASLSLSLPGRLMLGGQIEDRSSRLSGASGSDVGYRDRSGRLSLGYADHVSLEYRTTERSGQLSALVFGGWEEAYRLSLMAKLGPVLLSPRAEFGEAEHRLTGLREPFRRYALQSSVRMGTGQAFSATIERFTGSTLYAAGQDRTSGALDASVWLGAATRVHLAWSATRFESSTTRTYSVLDAGLEQRLPFGHRLRSRARVLRLGGVTPLDRSFVEVDYVIPFGLPVGLSRTSGRVVGRIYDAETGAALPNTVVRLGSRTVMTDERGRMSFSGLAPETYYLRVDRESIGLDRVPVAENPLPVRAERGAVTRLDVAIARSSRVAGRVRLFGFADGARADDPERPVTDLRGVASAIVALSHDDGTTLRRLTDESGRFLFSDLRPGRWTLRLVDAELPPHHYVERGTFELHLAPGAADEVSLRVLPKRRTVQIVAREEIVATPDGAVAHRTAPAGGVSPADRGAAAPPVRAPADAAPTGTAALQGYYTVTRWDVGLADIALKVYGDATLWPKIYLASRALVVGPDLVRPGIRLRVPRKAELTAEEEAVAVEHRARRAARAAGRRSSGPRVPANLQGYYTVTRWDVGLADIALKVYGDATLWPKIWLASRDVVADPDVIVPGLRLRVPLEASLTAEEREAEAEYLKDVRP